MNLRNLTIGAAALGLLAVTGAAPTRAMPVASPASAGAASDVVRARYQSKQYPHRGAYSYRSERSRAMTSETRSGRSVGKQKGSKHMKGRSQFQGRSVMSPRGVAPYSDIPKSMRSSGGRKAIPRGSQQPQQSGGSL
jgi:hypothetical protein